MRFFVRRAILLILGAAAIPAAAASLEGAWEGFIAETPARLTLIGVELHREADGWSGSLDLPGAPPDLPLSAIRADGDALHFELRLGDALVLFDAKIAGAALSGSVVEGERSYTFDLRKLPVYPTPANRVEAWKQDLDVVRGRFLRYDRSFGSEARTAFEKAIDGLEVSLPRLDDPQVVVALSRAVALSGNAHTRLYLLRNRTELRRLPLRLYWFADGLFVIRATAAQRDTVGCRVTRLAGRDPGELREQVAQLFAGNASWIDYKSPYFMTSPEILHGLGLIDGMDAVPFRLACPGRDPFERSLAPLPLERKDTPTEAWRDLSPAWQEEGWVGALAADRPAPLYLRDPRHHYWFEFLADRHALYVQYNRSQETPDGPGFDAFASQVEVFLATREVERLILDLRFNTGGNNGLASGFMERLAALETSGAIGKLVVITGRATFSAGISHAAHLKQASDAIFVGEPVGDVLDIWSEGGNLVLPNSGLTLHFTNGFHSLSAVERPECAPYLWDDLDLDDLAPDVVVRPSSEDYFAGRDPALAAALAAGD